MFTFHYCLKYSKLKKEIFEDYWCVYIDFPPIQVFLPCRNTSSAQKDNIKRKVSEYGIEVKSLFCTGDSWSLPTLLLRVSLPARCTAKSSGFIDFFVSPELSKSSPKPGASWGRGGEQQTLKGDILQPVQKVTVSKGEMISPHFCEAVFQLMALLTLPSVSLLPSLSLALFLSDASRKIKFMEVVPRAVFSALVLVGACSWLAQPSLLPAWLQNSFTSHKRWIMLPFISCLLGPSPQSWWVDPNSARYLQLHSLLLCRIKFPSQLPILGKMWLSSLFWDMHLF